MEFDCASHRSNASYQLLARLQVVLEWGVEGLQDEPVALLSAASVPSKDVPCVPGHERERAPSAEASTVACADGALGPTASQAVCGRCFRVTGVTLISACVSYLSQ